LLPALVAMILGAAIWFVASLTGVTDRLFFVFTQIVIGMAVLLIVFVIGRGNGQDEYVSDGKTTPFPTPSQPSTIPVDMARVDCPTVYQVQAGDNLLSIATKRQVDVGQSA
jgi:LysM repeat protein